MRIQELQYDQSAIVQILWGDQVIEFPTIVLNRDPNGIWVRPYYHEGKPLELNIEIKSGIVCNLFADNPFNNARVSWRNIELKTVTLNKEIAYYLSTVRFNELAKSDERRKNERIIIHKNAQIFDSNSNQFIKVLIHDISNIGISFYAPNDFKPASNQLTIIFSDCIDDKEFDMKISCIIARVQDRAGSSLYGCRISGDTNRDYLLYGCLQKLKKSKAKQGM